MSRRRLPAPPLVLRPVFRRAASGTSQAKDLLELANFLQRHGMLTGGGESKLKQELSGPGKPCSLTLQDVKSWAHGLVEQLLKPPRTPAKWSELKTEYLKTFDRGKPRRPTHLQRLYLRWSPDLDWTGLIETALKQPRIWPDIEHSVSFLDETSSEKHILELALRIRSHQDWTEWTEKFETHAEHRESYLKLLPLLDGVTLRDRITWLENYLAEATLDQQLQMPAIYCCLKRQSDSLFIGHCPRLLELNLKLISSQFCNVQPLLLFALLSTLNRPSSLPHWSEILAPQDPVLRIGFGARPGKCWVQDLWERLEAKLDMKI